MPEVTTSLAQHHQHSPGLLLSLQWVLDIGTPEIVTNHGSAVQSLDIMKRFPGANSVAITDTHCNKLSF